MYRIRLYINISSKCSYYMQRYYYILNIHYDLISSGVKYYSFKLPYVCYTFFNKIKSNSYRIISPVNWEFYPESFEVFKIVKTMFFGLLNLNSLLPTKIFTGKYIKNVKKKNAKKPEFFQFYLKTVHFFENYFLYKNKLKKIS